MGKDKDFSVFSCVVYSHLKAFGKKQENKITEKLAILQYLLQLIWIYSLMNKPLIYFNNKEIKIASFIKYYHQYKSFFNANCI